MATTSVLTNNWELGMMSDVPPDLMKPNALANLKNMLPSNMNTPLATRGAFEYGYVAAADLTGVSASSTGIDAVQYAPFQDGGKVILLDQNGRIISVNTSGTATLLDGTGFAEAPQAQGFFHLDREILLGSSGTKFPFYVTSNGSGVATSAQFVDPFPKALTGVSWGAYLLLANGGDFANTYNLNRRRIWFSNPGLFTYTAANNSYWDIPQVERIMGLAVLGNAIIVFGPRSSWILTGSTPPPNNDLILRPLYPYGLADYNSFKVWNGYIVFANERGVYKTDGTSLVDITRAAGLKYAFRGDMQAFSDGWTCAVGLYDDYMVITVCNTSGVEQFTYVFNLDTEVGFKFEGFPTKMYCEVSAGPHASVINSELDTIFGMHNVAQFGRLEPCFTRGKGSGKDANNVVINWEMITPFYRLGDLAQKRVRRAWWSYDYDNSSPNTDVPVFSYAVANDPFTGPTWNAMTAPPSGHLREPVFVNDKGRFIAFKINGGNSAGVKHFAVNGLEAELHLRESSKSD